MSRNTIVTISSSLLILLFFYTGLNKLFFYKAFLHQLNNQVFPHWIPPILVWILPAFEILVAIALLFQKTRRLGLLSSTVLMALFSSYIALILLNVFSRVPCSCGGVIKELGWVNHLYFNLFFLLAALTGTIMARKIEFASTKS